MGRQIHPGGVSGETGFAAGIGTGVEIDSGAYFAGAGFLAAAAPGHFQYIQRVSVNSRYHVSHLAWDMAESGEMEYNQRD